MHQTKRTIRAMLSEAGIRPLKRFGQHFLIDSNLMDKLVAASGLRREDAVLEIGTGTGALTRKLLEVSRSVISVEIDKGLYGICKDKFEEQSGLTLIHADILDQKSSISKTVLGQLTKTKKHISGRLLLVANLPYKIATPLLVNLLMGDIIISPMCITIQKEVAERIQAPAGGKSYGPISVFAQALTDIKKIARVPPQAFWPMPKVDSIMLRIEVCKEKSLSPEVREKLAELVHHCFNHRRKTMRVNLRTLLDEATLQMIEASKRWDLSDRPERITVPQWVELAKVLSS